MRNRILSVLITGLFFFSCTNEISEVNALTEVYEISIEQAKDVKIYYSDSAQVKVMIKGPTMNRHLDKNNPGEEFPDGVFVEFYGPSKNPTSWLTADHAIRYEKENKVIATGNVVLYNTKDDKLETPYLVWDDKHERIYSNQFVRITQPAKGDTSYGYGFEANQDFTRFEIKSYSAKMTMSEITSELNKNTAQ